MLEAERVSQTNPEKRGNSIFSEVEDRRQQVERHLAKLTTLLDKEKKKNLDLQAEIVKVKVTFRIVQCCNFTTYCQIPFMSSLEPSGVFSVWGKQC